MGLESASFVNDLVTTNPGATDAKAQGDDHLRLIKAALKSSFPNSTRAFYIPTSVAAATGTVTIAASDQGKITPVSASGASRTVNLPANAGIPDGFECTIFKTDSSANTVTIDLSNLLTASQMHAAGQLLSDLFFTMNNTLTVAGSVTSSANFLTVAADGSSSAASSG